MGRCWRRRGLKCPSAHLPFKKGGDFAEVFAQGRALGVQYVTSSNIFPPAKGRAAVAAGAPPAKAVFGKALGVEGFEYVAETMREAGEQAKKAGLQYAYHNHSHEFEVLPDGTVGYDFLLKNTDPALVKFEIDCGWMVVAGHDPAEYMRRYPGRFRMLHVKDFKKPANVFTTADSGARPTGSELGEGFIDYKPIFAAAKKAGVVHVFAEQEFPYRVSQMESAKADVGFFEGVQVGPGGGATRVSVLMKYGWGNAGVSPLPLVGRDDSMGGWLVEMTVWVVGWSR